MTQIANKSTMSWQCLINAGKLNADKLSDYESLNKASISPSDRAFAYGDGFFTTMGVRHGRVLWLAKHKQRLNSHLHALHLCLSNADRQSVWDAVIATANDMGQGIIKLIASRQPQTLRGYAFSVDVQDNACQVWLGVLPVDQFYANTNTDTDLNNTSIDSINPHIIAFAKHCSIFTNKHYATSIPIQPPITAVCLQAQLSCLPANLVGLKTLNRLDNVMAAGELERYKRKFAKSKRTEHSVGDGLVKDVSGQWVEGVMSNVFYQLGSDNIDNQDNKYNKDDSDENYSNLKPWYTPPIDVSGVNGVMREVIMQAAEHQAMSETDAKYVVIQRRLVDADLPKLTSLFFCNAVRGIIPASHLIDLQGGIVTLNDSKALTDKGTDR